MVIVSTSVLIHIHNLCVIVKQFDSYMIVRKHIAQGVGSCSYGNIYAVTAQRAASMTYFQQGFPSS